MKFAMSRLLIFGSLPALMALLPVVAVAQTFACPSGPGPGEIRVGMSGGSGGVAPIPVCASDGSQDDSGYDDSQRNAPVWETRWGAIATGDGGLGAVTDMRSERQAKKAAIKQCKATANGGGPNCKAFSYYNQCAVIAWGSTGYILQRAENISTASSLGMQKCNSQYQECEIFYSGCSYAKRVN